MTEIEKAEQTFKETQAALDSLNKEAAELPTAIAEAAKIGNVARVTELRQRQAQLKSELFVGNLANRNAQLSFFEAQKAAADERAERAAAVRAERMPELAEEESRMVARLRELPIEAQRLHNAVAGPQEESRGLVSRIAQCRKELDAYIERESSGESQPAQRVAA